LLILLANFSPQAPSLLNAEGGLRWPLLVGAAVLFAAVLFGMVRVRPPLEPES
jgi:hypothetical protein